MKWQTILTITGGSSVSVFIILLLVLNLSGMSYGIPGDIDCSTDCFSEIKVNSTYWEVCVEHSGDKPVIYKKMSRSRRLWLNLDKIDSVVDTNPNVFTEILVPTVKRYSEFNTEYGYLRKVKDGDCIIKRRTKANNRPSRIIVHGIKSPGQTVKWGFNIDNFLMDGIEFDPVWRGFPSSSWGIALGSGEADNNLSGLVGLWHFNWNAIDSSDNNNDGIVTGVTNTSLGKYGGAYEFDGAGDYVDVGNDTSLQITGNITVMAWIYPKAIESAGLWDRIIAKGANSQYEFSVSTNDPGAGSLGLIARINNDSIQTFSSLRVPELNVWSHIAFSYNGSNVMIYHNGTRVFIGNMSGTFNTTSSNLTIGDWSTKGREFNGTIDEVMIFDRSLSSDEIFGFYVQTSKIILEVNGTISIKN